MNEYLILIRENVSNYEKMTPEAMQKSIEEHVKWVEKLMSNGNFKGGNPLSPEGKCIKGEKMLVTDGPYIEVKEGISGYYFLLANSLEEATEITKECPSLIMDNASLEVREIIQTDQE